MALTATIRKVLKGDGTLIESDDTVDFHTGTTRPLRVVLVTAEEQRVPVWVLRAADGRILHLKRSADVPEQLQLASFDAALALQAYLARAADPGQIAGRTLVLPPSQAPLDGGQAQGLQVHRQFIAP